MRPSAHENLANLSDLGIAERLQMFGLEDRFRAWVDGLPNLPELYAEFTDLTRLVRDHFGDLTSTPEGDRLYDELLNRYQDDLDRLGEGF